MFARARERVASAVGEEPFPSRSFTALWRNCNCPCIRPLTRWYKVFHDAAGRAHAAITIYMINCRHRAAINDVVRAVNRSCTIGC